MPSSYAAPPTHHELLARRLHAQPQVGDRAVDRVVLGAVRVGVDPAHEVLARARTPRRARAGRRRRAELAALGRLADLDTRRPGPPSAWRVPASDSAPLPTQGVVSGPSLILPIAASSQSPASLRPCSQIQRSACWAPQLWPTIPRQPSSVERAAVHRERAVEARGRRRAQQLGARQPRAVHPVARQVEQRRLGAVEAQLPRDPRRGPRRRAPGRSRPPPLRATRRRPRAARPP